LIVNKSDFIPIKILGKGAYGKVKCQLIKVLLVEKNDTKELFALKSINKKKVVEENLIEMLHSERQLLINVLIYIIIKNCDFLVNLKYSFQTNTKVFLVMPFLKGGEISQVIKKLKKLKESHAKFYAAEIVLAFEYLHHNGVIYRDLKP
jgi:serine/threonine protein kinase